jgi:hypothetical protein
MKENVLLKYRKILPFLACIGIILAVSAWVPSLGRLQDPKKSIEKLAIFSNDPLEITRIKAANQTVRLRQELTATDDWLNGLEFTVKNVSGKGIVFIDLQLDFPDTKSSGSEMAYPIRLGERPGVISGTPPVVLPIDGEAILKLEGSKYEELVKFIGLRHPISALNKVIIDVRLVVFDDETGWALGKFLLHDRDPKHQFRYIPIQN